MPASEQRQQYKVKGWQESTGKDKAGGTSPEVGQDRCRHEGSKEQTSKPIPWHSVLSFSHLCSQLQWFIKL